MRRYSLIIIWEICCQQHDVSLRCFYHSAACGSILHFGIRLNPAHAERRLQQKMVCMLATAPDNKYQGLSSTLPKLCDICPLPLTKAVCMLLCRTGITCKKQKSIIIKRGQRANRALIGGQATRLLSAPAEDSHHAIRGSSR